jgi:hypothetical protein
VGVAILTSMSRHFIGNIIQVMKKVLILINNLIMCCCAGHG